MNCNVGKHVRRSCQDFLVVSSDDMNQLTTTCLITVGVTTDHNGLLPGIDESRNILADDGFTEDRPTEDVPDRSVW